MYKIFNEDCLIGMKKIADGSVDLILDDLPFGTTDCPFDRKIPLQDMWAEFLRVTKENAAIVLFSQMPFGAELITSNPTMFRYEIIYNKATPVGFLNAKRMPLRAHENILVFYRKLPTYNPQFTAGKPYKKLSAGIMTGNYMNKQRESKISNGRRYPVDIIKAAQPICTSEEVYHPQQKPQALLEYLIRPYTNSGDVVLDATMGSGSTGVAAINTGRRFIGFETEQKFFDVARERLESATAAKEKIFARLQDGDLKIFDKPTAELIPYENNPRNNDKAVDAVAKSIGAFGFKIPIVIDSAGVIICGHTRFKAALKLGLKSVPVIIADDLTADEIKAFKLVDNKTAEYASWAVDDLNAELAALSNFNMQDFGFDVSAVKGVDVSHYEFNEYFALPTETADERKEFQMTFLLHKKQAALIHDAINQVGKPAETFGNTSEAGNKIYEIIRQWSELRK